MCADGVDSKQVVLFSPKQFDLKLSSVGFLCPYTSDFFFCLVVKHSAT